MLKRVVINNKKVPVPVPVQTLDDALRWVEDTLVPAGHTITRVSLDDKLLTGREPDPSVKGETLLDDESRLEIQIDSPTDLTIQTLDAIRNLSAVMLASLKALAVECWQARGSVRPGELDAVLNDGELLLDLIEHVTGLVDAQHAEAAAIQGIAGILKRAAVGLAMARANSDWKGAAKILLNKIEPLLKDLTAEAETMHVRIATLPTSAPFTQRNTRAPAG